MMEGECEGEGEREENKHEEGHSKSHGKICTVYVRDVLTQYWNNSVKIITRAFTVRTCHKNIML